MRADDEHSGDAELVSPMPGSVVAVNVAHGDTVNAGTVVVVVEAMKMEHSLTAPVDGVVELLVAVGDQVKVGQLLARITATTNIQRVWSATSRSAAASASACWRSSLSSCPSSLSASMTSARALPLMRLAVVAES